MPEEEAVQTSTNPRRALYTERFKTKFEEKFRKNTNGCWVWTAYRDKDDYGQVRVGELGTFRSHRISFELYKGIDIPETDPETGEQMDIDHTCHIRRCVNPEHLELVTHGENMNRLRKPVDDWEDEGKKFKEVRTTPEEILDAALATIAESQVPIPVFGKGGGYAIGEEGGAPWRDIQTNDGFLPQDKYSRVKMFFNVIRLGVDWNLAAREVLGISPWTIQNWRDNGDFKEELDEARAEGKRYRYTILEDKHLDELERKIEDADFKEVADSLEKMRKHDPATKKDAAAAGATQGSGNMTFIFNVGDKNKALKEMIDMSDVLEAEFEVKE